MRPAGLETGRKQGFPSGGAVSTNMLGPQGLLPSSAPPLLVTLAGEGLVPPTLPHPRWQNARPHPAWKHLPPESSLCSDLHALPGPRGTSLSTLDLTVHTGCVTPLEIPHAPTPRSVLLLPGPSPLPVCRPLAPGQIPTGLESQAGRGEAAEAGGLCGRAGRGSSDGEGQATITGDENFYMVIMASGFEKNGDTLGEILNSLEMK